MIIIVIIIIKVIKVTIRFESGNLAKAVRITDTYYELHLRYLEDMQISPLGTGLNSGCGSHIGTQHPYLKNREERSPYFFFKISASGNPGT